MMQGRSSSGIGATTYMHASQYSPDGPPPPLQRQSIVQQEQQQAAVVGGPDVLFDTSGMAPMSQYENVQYMMDLENNNIYMKLN